MGSGPPDLGWGMGLSPVSTTSGLCDCMDYLLLRNKPCQTGGLRLLCLLRISQSGPGPAVPRCLPPSLGFPTPWRLDPQKQEAQAAKPSQCPGLEVPECHFFSILLVKAVLDSTQIPEEGT